MTSTSTPASPIPTLRSRADVAAFLGVSAGRLTWWLWGLPAPRRYERFEVARRNGGAPRVIHAPIKPVKELQRRLADTLLEVYQPRVYVHGFVGGRSPLTNAQQHQGQRWVLKLDLHDFFPTINFGRVRGMFMAYPFEYPAEAATTLAQLCCHENHLPQGAPTSPIVSNFICRGLDADLGRLARKERCRYTRYADDICLSTSHTEFRLELVTTSDGHVQLGDLLTSIVRKHGFDISSEKTRLLRRSRRQRVTGLIVNRRANVPVEYVRSIRNLLYIWEKHGEADAVAAFRRHETPRNRPPWTGEVGFRPMIRGRVQYVGSVRGWGDNRYRQLADRLARLDDGFTPRTFSSLDRVERVRIYTEGESDGIHLSAALQSFKARGEFRNLEFEIPVDSPAGGDTKLLRRSDELAQSDQPLRCVCVFDRDDEETVRKAVGSTTSSVRSRRVVNVVIAAPEWRDQRVCIELLYTDTDLRRRDANGRRLYLSEEFHSRTGQHSDEEVHVAHPDGNRPSRTLVREEVFPYGSDESVGLSKTAFAKYVAEGAEGFEDVSFEGFKETLENIEQAVVRLLRA